MTTGLSDHDLTMKKEPTRTCATTKALIDIIASTKLELIRSTQVFPSGFSDHDLVGCIRNRNHQKFSPKEIKCRDYTRYSVSEINNELSTADWSDFYETNDVNKAWKVFHHIMLNILDRHAPISVKRVKSKPAPWLTPEIKAAMNDRDRQLRKFRRSNLDKDKIEYKHTRNHVNILLRKAKSNYNKAQLRENANDPDKFWKTIKSIYPATAKNNDSIHRFEINGEISSDEKTIANGFKTFFSGIIHSLKSKAIPTADFIWCKPKDINPRTYKTFLPKPATPDEVYGVLKKLRRKEATGSDGLPASFL